MKTSIQRSKSVPATETLTQKPKSAPVSDTFTQRSKNVPTTDTIVIKPKYEKKEIVHNYDIKTKPKVTKVPNIRNISENTINNFLSSVSSLPALSDARAIVSIIAECQPDIEISYPDARIDINDLTDDTIMRCIEYTQKRYTDLNKIYPL